MNDLCFTEMCYYSALETDFCLWCPYSPGSPYITKAIHTIFMFTDNCCLLPQSVLLFNAVADS